MKLILDIRDFGVDKVHLGCGNVHLSGWLNVDLNASSAVDLNLNILDLQFHEGTIKEIYACHVIEHLTPLQCNELLSSCNRWLTSGGRLTLAVPDFQSIVDHYLNYKDLRVLRGLLLGGGKDEYDIHRSVFDFISLKETLSLIGFINISRYEWREHYVGTNNIDDFSQAYLPHMNKASGQLMSLNMIAEKL